MKLLLIVLITLTCSACGTLSSIAPKYNQIEITHNGAESYCKSIPRVYSGVSYNFCQIAGEPNRNVSGNPMAHLTFMWFDTLLCGVADTVMLPYTIPMQIKEGSIDVNKKPPYL